MTPRARLVVTLVAIAGLTALSASLPRWEHETAPDVRLLGAAVLLVLGGLPIARLRTGHSQEVFNVAEAAVAVGVVLVPWWQLSAAAGGASLLVQLARRAGWNSKMLFNISSDVVAAAAAGLVAGRLGVHAGMPVRGPAAYAAVAVAATVAALWSALALTMVVSAVQEVAPREVLRLGLRFRVLGLVANVGLGLGVLALATYAPWGLATLPVLALLLVRVQQEQLRADQESEVWRQLEAAGRDLDQLDEPELVARALQRTTALVRCDTAELVLHAHGRPGVLVRALVDRTGVVREQSETEAALEVPAPSERALPTTDATGTTLEVGLAGPDAPLGLLRVRLASRDERPVPVRERDLQVLGTWGRAVAGAVVAGRLYADALAEAELKAWQAGHDALTGLRNRAGLLELADELVDDEQPWGVLVLGLDHFKQVNDVLGHEGGDRLLQHVAQVLAARVRRGDVAARLEGDLFAVLLRHLDADPSASSVADDLLRIVSEPVEHDGTRLSLECTIGYAVAPADGTGLPELLRRAERTCYDSKSAPGSARRWEADRAEDSLERLALSADLRAGLTSGDALVLHYQPQLDLVSGQVAAAEVLARWQHPERGLLPPGEFIEVAERSGLARPFTLAVLDAAVGQAAAWRAEGLAGGELSVAVNLSARNLLDRELPGEVAVVLARHGLPARLLTLEITETVVVSELEVVTDVLHRLRTLGVRLSVDDFGTGYSSLAFLQRVRVNEIKIDRSFVGRLTTEEGAGAIVRATVELGHGLGLRVVAEGVEDEGTLAALEAAGCDSAQGFHLARPMPAAELRELLAPRRSDGGSVVVPLRAAQRRRTGSA